MVCSFTDYDVYGWYGIFLLPFKTRQRQLGTSKKRFDLISREKLPYSKSYAKYLAKNGLAPCLQQRGLLSRRSVLACWECEEAFTDINEGDNVSALHRQLSPRCKTAAGLSITTPFWKTLCCCCRSWLHGTTK